MKYTANEQIIKRLQQLENLQEQLRMQATQVDLHAAQFTTAIKKKRVHVANIANIGNLVDGFGLAKQASGQLSEALLGSEYSAIIAHMQQYQENLAQQLRQVTAGVEELRGQLANQQYEQSGLLEEGC